MNRDLVADRIAVVKGKFLMEIFPKARDQYEEKAFSSIVSHLDEMENECRTGQLKSKDERYGLIARLVAESDPNLLAPEFGGQLIDVEKIYRDL